MSIASSYGRGDKTENSTNNATSAEVKGKKQVAVIDFSKMPFADITLWCKNNNINCFEKMDYSDTIEKGSFISQDKEDGQKINEGNAVNITYSLGKAPTISQRNAVKKAESYLDYSSFSRSGLIKQLEYEKFSKDDATYAVDNITVNWDEQAAKKAKSYLDYSSFSRDGLINQLKYEGFTQAQAEYGVGKTGL